WLRRRPISGRPISTRERLAKPRWRPFIGLPS
ncbi:uncharacterized protein METZ01_LOCUS418739, partial [marine metagenome]